MKGDAQLIEQTAKIVALHEQSLRILGFEVAEIAVLRRTRPLRYATTIRISFYKGGIYLRTEFSFARIERERSKIEFSQIMHIRMEKALVALTDQAGVEWSP